MNNSTNERWSATRGAGIALVFLLIGMLLLAPTGFGDEDGVPSDASPTLAETGGGAEQSDEASLSEGAEAGSEDPSDATASGSEEGPGGASQSGAEGADPSATTAPGSESANPTGDAAPGGDATQTPEEKTAPAKEAPNEAVPDVAIPNEAVPEETIPAETPGVMALGLDLQVQSAAADLLAADEVYVDTSNDLMNALENGVATRIKLAPGDYRFAAGVIQSKSGFLWNYGYPCVSRDVAFVCDGGEARIFSETGHRHLFLLGDNQTLTFSGVTLDGGGSGGGITHLGNDALTLKNAHIVNCIANDTTRGELYGGAVDVGIGALYLTDCVFDHNQAKHGGAVFTEKGGLMTGCTFTSNRAINPTDKEDGYGGAISVNSSMHDGGPLVIEDGYFEDNYADELGGAIGNYYTSKMESLTVRNTMFADNRSGADGGAIGIGTVGGNSLIESCTFTGNLAGQNASAHPGHGGAIYSLSGNLTVLEVTISGGGGTLGAAIATSTNDGNLSIDTCVITENTAKWNGGAIWAGNVGNVSIADTQVIKNKAGWSGGGAYMENVGIVSIVNGRFQENEAVDNGGGLDLQNIGDAMITDTDFVDNHATNVKNSSGGAIYSGIYTRNDKVVMSGGSIDGNSAIMGGGWFVYDASPTLRGVAVTNNTAKTGGGIYNFLAAVTVSDSTISGNSANTGGGAFVSSYPKNDVEFVMANSVFENNTANNGGGIYSYEYAFGMLQIPADKTATFRGNVSTQTYYPDASKPATTFAGTVTEISPNFSADRLAPGLNVLVFNNDDINLQYALATAWPVRYHAEGGEGSMATAYVVDGDPFTLAENAFTREYHTFADWNTVSTGTGTGYADQYAFERYDLKSALDLYAQWQPITTADYTVRHYLVDESGVTTLADTDTITGNIDDVVTAQPKTYAGYTHDPAHTGSVLSGKVLRDGSLVLSLYYKANVKPPEDTKEPEKPAAPEKPVTPERPVPPPEKPVTPERPVPPPETPVAPPTPAPAPTPAPTPAPATSAPPAAAAPIAPAQTVRPAAPTQPAALVEIPDAPIAEDKRSDAADTYTLPDDEEVPVSDDAVRGSWSIVSLFAGTLGALIAIATGITACSDSRASAEYERRTRRVKRVWTSFAVTFGALTPAIFLLLDDLSLSPAWVNGHTPIVCTAFVVAAVSGERFAAEHLRARTETAI